MGRPLSSRRRSGRAGISTEDQSSDSQEETAPTTAVLSPFRVVAALYMMLGARLLIVPSGPSCSGCILLIKMYTVIYCTTVTHV